LKATGFANGMKSLYMKLSDRLEVEGWDTVQTYSDNLEWWADEIWQLKSHWPPEGAVAFVTFLVDPSWQGSRSKGEGVWGAGCGTEYPRTREEATRVDTLPSDASKEDIEEFVDVLDGIRTLRSGS